MIDFILRIVGWILNGLLIIAVVTYLIRAFRRMWKDANNMF